MNRHSLALAFVTFLATAPAVRAQMSIGDCQRWQNAHRGARLPLECRMMNAYPERSASVFLEEDFLQRVGSTSDRNYTMGLGFSRSGPMIAEHNHDKPLRGAERTVDWLLNHSVRPLTGDRFRENFLASYNLDDWSTNRAFSETLAGTAFSPKDLRAVGPVEGDRPYAFLLGWTIMRVKAPANGDDAYTSELTLGTVGSRLGRNVQRFIHARSRASSGDPTPYDPKGWGNQIMDVPSVLVGWPTARYGFTWSHRLANIQTSPESGSSLFDLAQDWGGELGYYTGTSFGLRARAGIFSVPYWAWRQDPLSSGSRALTNGRACVDLLVVCVDAFAYAGARGRFMAYNELLQGVPGYTGYHIGWSDRNYFGTEVQTGLASTIWDHSRTWGVQGVFELFSIRSAEYKGPYQRAHRWGGLFLTVVSPRL